jgi:uncharacterized membrane protein
MTSVLLCVYAKTWVIIATLHKYFYRHRINNMVELIVWYLVLLTFSISFYYLISLVLNKFVDKGYAFSKVVFIVFTSYIYWVLKHFSLSELAITATISLLYITIFAVSFKRGLLNLVKNNKKQIIYTELVFLIAYLAYTLFRAINPRIEGVEKLMDIAIVNSLAKSNSFPPKDVWFSSKTINYYYFGHLAPSWSIELFKFRFEYFYNTYLATIFALSFTAGFSIANTLTKKIRYALLLPILMLVAGNLDLILKKLSLQANYYYAEARSLLEYVITEFPAYSFLLGDLHAHLLNIPKVLLTIALAINLFLDNKTNNLKISFTGFVLGTLFITNSWDFIVYTPLIFLILFAKEFKKGKAIFKTLSMSYAVILLSATVPFILFHLNFEPAVSGFGFSKDFSGLKVIFTMFGAFIFMVLPFLATYLTKRKFKKDTNLLAVIFAAYGIFLVLLPEIGFLKDIYHTANPNFYRANTVFKIWYQAWVVLSIAGVYSIYYLANNLKTSFKYPYLICTTLLVIATLIYPINGVVYLFKANKAVRFKTLNGISYLNDNNSDEKEAIDWLNKNLAQQVVIMEKPGDAYTTDSLFSSYTGNPTPLGWINHEYGWRGDWAVVSAVLVDVENAYKLEDAKTISTILQKNNVDYVVIGPKEKQKYGDTAGKVIAKEGQVVFENESIKVVKVN